MLCYAKSLQSCPTLCDPIDGSPPGSPVLGILQARILEWVAISFSSAWKWKVKVKSVSRVGLLAIPWTTAYQAPPSMGFSRQEYWSGVPLPSPNLKLLIINSSFWLAETDFLWVNLTNGMYVEQDESQMKTHMIKKVGRKLTSPRCDHGRGAGNISLTSFTAC